MADVELITENIPIVTSNLSLPLQLMAGGGLRAHEKYLADIGVDGLQITPTRASQFIGRIISYGAKLEYYETNRVPLIERGPTGKFSHDMINGLFDTPPPRARYAADSLSRIIHSVHESFRDVVDDGLKARFFPKWPNSVDQMRHIQSAAGKDLLSVMYPVFRSGRLIEYDYSVTMMKTGRPSTHLLS